MSVSIIKAISYAGVYVGAVIGAGYASGQEVLQFFAGYGFIGMLGAVITMIMLAWYGTVRCLWNWVISLKPIVIVWF